MKTKNIVKYVKGEVLYTPATYARKYGRAIREVCDSMKEGRIRVVVYYNRRYVTGEPPAGWQIADSWVEPEIKEKRVPKLPPSPLLEDVPEPDATAGQGDKPKRVRHNVARVYDLNAEKARKTHAEAETAELKLADKRGELADKYVNMFYDCFTAALQPYKMAITELDLKHDNIVLLQSKLDNLVSDLANNIKKALLADRGEQVEDEEPEQEEDE